MEELKPHREILGCHGYGHPARVFRWVEPEHEVVPEIWHGLISCQRGNHCASFDHTFKHFPSGSTADERETNWLKTLNYHIDLWNTRNSVIVDDECPLWFQSLYATDVRGSGEAYASSHAKKLWVKILEGLRTPNIACTKACKNLSHMIGSRHVEGCAALSQQEQSDDRN